jgi:hypothetical protein
MRNLQFIKDNCQADAEATVTSSVYHRENSEGALRLKVIIIWRRG